jgi:hypothetical protein
VAAREREIDAAQEMMQSQKEVAYQEQHAARRATEQAALEVAAVQVRVGQMEMHRREEEAKALRVKACSRHFNAIRTPC